MSAPRWIWRKRRGNITLRRFVIAGQRDALTRRSTRDGRLIRAAVVAVGSDGYKNPPQEGSCTTPASHERAPLPFHHRAARTLTWGSCTAPASQEQAPLPLHPQAA